MTSLGSTWSYCYSLKTLNVSGWDTSKWAVTIMSQAWNQCQCLESVDISDWDTSKWTVSNVQYLFRQCRSLKSINLGSLNLSRVTNNSYIPNFEDCRYLTSFNGFNGFALSWTISYSPLSRQSCLAILQSLPQASGKKITFHLMVYHRLLPEDIAIATAKGWTVAGS